MKNGSREQKYIHLRRGDACSTEPSSSLRFALALWPSPILLLSSLLLLYTSRFFFFFFFIPPPSLLFAPFLFINYKSQLPLGFFFFLFVLFCFSFLGLSFRLGDCGRAYLEDVVLVHFCVVLHSLSFLRFGVFLSFPVHTCDFIFIFLGIFGCVFLSFAQAAIFSSPR